MDLDAVLSELKDPGTAVEERRELAATLLECGEEDVARVEEALFELASSTDDTELADAFGETLGTLWVQHERLSLDLLQQLEGVARELAVGTLWNLKPDWREVLEALGFTQA